MPHAASLTLLLIIGATVQALESNGPDMLVDDIRIGFGVAGLPTKQENEDNLTDVYGQSYGFSGTLGGVVGHLDPVGLLYGGEIRYLSGDMTLDKMEVDGKTVATASQLEQGTGSSLPDSTYTEVGIAANIGAGFAMTDNLHLELIGIGGVNWTTLDRVAINVDTGKLMTTEGAGWGYTLGGRVGMFWTDPNSNWQYGLTGEYTYSNAELEVEYINATVTGDVDYSTFSLRASMGSRF
jgi:hypothetical protein